MFSFLYMTRALTCNVVDNCFELLVIIPCNATGCCGISMFTGPIDNKPLFLSLPRRDTLEYNVWLLPTVTRTTVLQNDID